MAARPETTNHGGCLYSVVPSAPRGPWFHETGVHAKRDAYGLGGNDASALVGALAHAR